jgi:hypothetical protein
MASTCLWRSWESTVEWDADATVPPDIRTQFAAFLDHVGAALQSVFANSNFSCRPALSGLRGRLASSPACRFSVDLQGPALSRSA